MEQSVPKRRHIKFRPRGITQKKAYNYYRLLGSSTLHSRSNSEFSATERVHRWLYPRDDPTISYSLLLLFCYVHQVKLLLYWTAVPWWNTVLEKRITSHLPKNFLHFMNPYCLLYLPKEAAAVSCAESGTSSPHIPTQCYSPGYTWSWERSPSFRLTRPNPIFISLLSYECHMAKPYPWLNCHNNIWKVIKLVNLLLWSFPQPSLSACNLDANYFPNTLYSRILRLLYSFKVRDQISRPYIKKNMIWARYI